jgi:hypothetical protein
MATTTKQPTYCEILLDALADGQPKSHRSLYRLGRIVHSRVAELRRRRLAVRAC